MDLMNNFISKNRDTASFVEEYTNLNRAFACEKDLSFMNHGLSPIDDKLLDSKILLKQCATLYLKTVEGIENNKSKLLEIGCGRGGGLDTIKTFYPELELFGCDICPTNIVYSKYFNNSIDYRVGNAMDLPYEDNQFDYLLNIESSHCYNNIEMFYSECARVLKPNGKLLYSDLVESVEHLKRNYSLLNKYFTIDSFVDITENVVESCKELVDTLRDHNRRPGYSNLYKIMSDKYQIYSKRENHFFIMQLTVKN